MKNLSHHEECYSLLDVMNFPSTELLLGRQRSRQWVPLLSQQVSARVKLFGGPPIVSNYSSDYGTSLTYWHSILRRRNQIVSTLRSIWHQCVHRFILVRKLKGQISNGLNWMLKTLSILLYLVSFSVSLYKIWCRQLPIIMALVIILLFFKNK